MEEIQSFDGNIEELSSLMRTSWAANKQEALLYTESFLASALRQPGVSPDLCPAIYDRGALVACGAVFPRTIRVAARNWNLPLNSFLTVALDYQKWGALGLQVWRAMADRAKQHGADGMFSFCVEGDKMDQSMLKIARFNKLPTLKAYTVRYLARPVPKGRGPIARADADVLLRCSERLSDDIDFRRVWTAAEANWQCNTRDGAFGAVLQNGEVEGTITASTMLTANAKPVSCGLVDDILWDQLEPSDKSKLLGQLMDSASAAAVDLLLVPVMNYTDTTPFLNAGFRKTKRVLNMYLTAWNPEFPLSELSAAYIDVL